MSRRFVLLAALIAWTALQGNAAVLFNNGGPNTANGYSIQGSNWTADDFSLAGGGTVRSVGFYFQNYAGISGWSQNVTYSIIANASGPFGSVLATGSGQNVTPIDSGLPWCCGGGNAYQVTFDLATPFTAAAGTTYWLSLSGATGSSSAWWVTANDNASLFAYTNYGQATGSGQRQFAFFLDSDPVGPPSGIPEPGTVALLSSGLAALIIYSRRRRT